MIDYEKQLANIMMGLCDDRPPRHGMFLLHRCWKCNDGERPCPQGNPRECEYPHARDD